MTINEIIMFLNEVLLMQHAQDWKFIASLLFFWSTFFTSIVLLYDMVRGQKRKVIGGDCTGVVVAQGIAFFSMGVFGFVRTLDAIADAAFVLVNPSAVTTLSQQSIILEVPLIISAISIFIYTGIYIKDYLKKPYLKDKE